MKNNYNPQRRQLIKKSSRLMGLAALSGVAGKGLADTESTEAPAEELPQYGIEGLEAPELDVNYWINADGKESSFSIDENRGKWIFLKCFQNWCPGCHASGFPTLKAFANEFHEHPKVAIAGIQTVFEGFHHNTQDDVRELQLKYELPITMGHDAGDPDGLSISDTMLKFRTGGTPWLILINPDGVVAYNDFRVNTTKLIQFMHEEVGFHG